MPTGNSSQKKAGSGIAGPTRRGVSEGEPSATWICLVTFRERALPGDSIELRQREIAGLSAAPYGFTHSVQVP
jgi:hypothetical protein